MKKLFLISVLSIIIAIVPIFSTPAFGASKNTVESQLSELKGGISQVVLVSTSKRSSRTAVISFYEKKKGVWKKVYSNMNGVVGKNGITAKKKEGDGKTPKGVYSLTTAFGTSAKPSGVELPYTKTNRYHYWIDDVKSKDYNKMVYYRGNPDKKWKSYERLTHKLYSHAVVINYNRKTTPIVKGKGSAIFLHTKEATTKYTLGCVAMYKDSLIKVMKRLDPDLRPHIIITESSNLKTVIKDFESNKKK